MRMEMALLTVMVVTASACGQDAKNAKLAKRHDIEVDTVTYPQATPKESLASVLKAIEAGKFNYLLAQLSEPDWVDRRVKEVHHGKFAAMVEETSGKFANDRTAIKDLRRFLQEGTWETTDTTATAQLKDVKNRRVYMRRLEGRWFLEDRKDAKTEK